MADESSLTRSRDRHDEIDRSVMKARVLVAVAVTVFMAATELRGLVHQTESLQRQPLFTSEADLVVLHVMVKDRKGAYVSDLPQDAFRVLEDNRPQTIHVFTGEDAPATIGLLIDASGSMRGARDLVIAAVSAFARSSHPQDELFALAFNEDVQAVLPAEAPFTADAATLEHALTRTLGARGQTALYDALVQGFDYVAKGRHDRKVLVIISDGGDNASAATLDEVLGRTRTSNTVVFTIALIDPLEPEANPKRLRQIAEPSGGEAFAPRNAAQVSDVLQHIARDIRHSYTIGYVPTSPRDGAFHAIHVAVKPLDGRAVTVRTRTGYLATRRR
jgi:VWFA-related protein